MNRLPPLVVLKERLELRGDTLYWRDGPRAGKPAASQKGRGYLQLRLDGVSLLAHRVVWALTRNKDPYPHQVDHRKGKSNHPSNLRLARNAQNLANRQGLNSNNTSGVAGVSWHKAAQKWHAEIKVKGKKHNLGLFKALSSAKRARKEAESRLLGEFKPTF